MNAACWATRAAFLARGAVAWGVAASRVHGSPEVVRSARRDLSGGGTHFCACTSDQSEVRQDEVSRLLMSHLLTSLLP